LWQHFFEVWKNFSHKGHKEHKGRKEDKQTRRWLSKGIGQKDHGQKNGAIELLVYLT
jgi:hypothetical protein